jgi:DNA-binding response OmpR family regulator
MNMIAQPTEFQSHVMQTGIDLDEMYSPDRQRILVVEDDLDTVSLLKQIFRMAGFDVFSATTGREALKKCTELSPALVVLDLMMPDMDGWETFQYLHQMMDVPVIIVSALGSKEDVVKALHLGVDDYITKPFFNAELVERSRAVLRRSNAGHPVNRLVYPKMGLLIDLNTQEVTFQDQKLYLTNKEFAILSTLAKNSPELVSYHKIATTIWGEDTLKTRQRMKYLVYLLRRKFESIDRNSPLIVNVGRLGYKLQVEN